MLNSNTKGGSTQLIGEAGPSTTSNSATWQSFPFNGASVDIVLLRHAYSKHVRCNPHPNASRQVSGHGGTSRFAQWRLHAMSADIIKLQNKRTGNYLRVVNGKSGGKQRPIVDVGGKGGKFTLFRVKRNVWPNSNQLIALESVQFSGHYISVNPSCTVSAIQYTSNTTPNLSKDFAFCLYGRRNQAINTSAPVASSSSSSISSSQCEEKKEAPCNMNKNRILQSGTAVIQHALGQSLRIAPANHAAINAHGGTGGLARWGVETYDHNTIKLKNLKTNKYIRVYNDGNNCDVNGMQNDKCTLLQYDPNLRTLQSAAWSNCWLAINAQSHVCMVKSNQDCNYQYTFDFLYVEDGGIVVLQHSFGHTLRVHPQNETCINGHGGRGKFARWQIEYMHNRTIVKLKSTRTGRYLRIVRNHNNNNNDSASDSLWKVDVQGNGGAYTTFKYDATNRTLQSNRFPGVFVAVREPHDVFAIQMNTSADQQSQDKTISMRIDIMGADDPCPSHGKPKNKFAQMYALHAAKSQDVVVLRALSNNKSLRVNPTQLFLSNCLGGCGMFARWNVIVHNADQHIIKLQSVKSKKYIRISAKGAIDVRGNGGRYTHFRVHRVQDKENVYVFESVVFQTKYLACDTNGQMFVMQSNDGVTNKQCMFSAWQQSESAMDQAGGMPNAKNKDEVIASQQQLIEQQKRFIDQLQRTVTAQQRIIERLGGEGITQDMNDNSTQTNEVVMGEQEAEDGAVLVNPGAQVEVFPPDIAQDEEVEEDEFEYVQSPGSCN